MACERFAFNPNAAALQPNSLPNDGDSAGAGVGLVCAQSFGTFFSNSDHDLSDLGVRFHIAVGYGDVRERKSFTNDRSEVPIGKMLENELFGLHELLGKFLGI